MEVKEEPKPAEKTILDISKNAPKVSHGPYAGFQFLSKWKFILDDKSPPPILQENFLIFPGPDSARQDAQKQSPLYYPECMLIYMNKNVNYYNQDYWSTDPFLLVP